MSRPLREEGREGHEVKKQPRDLAIERLLLCHDKDKAPWNLHSRLDTESFDLLAEGKVSYATVSQERPGGAAVFALPRRGPLRSESAGSAAPAQDSGDSGKTTTKRAPAPGDRSDGLDGPSRVDRAARARVLRGGPLHVRAPPEDRAASLASATRGLALGPAWSTHWLRIAVSIPAGWAGREVHLVFDCGGEAMVWRDGAPFQGLLGGSGDDRRARVVLHRAYEPRAEDEPEILWIEVAGTYMFGVGAGNQWGGLGPSPPDRDRVFELVECRLAVFDRDAWELAMDLKVAAGLAKELPEGSVRAEDALRACQASLNALDVTDPATRPAARAPLEKFFAPRNGGAQHTIVAVGNSHTDYVWLWPMDETVRKAARTFATQLRLMERDPDYVFAISQAALLDLIRLEYPELFAEVRARTLEGRFVVVGGTWVEMDCNITGGESMVRQFLAGQRFFREHFGVTCEEFWLPDTFGYAAQLPQLIRQAGMSCFLTQKLSWNQFNKFPHHTFQWEGLDGSRVLTHFPPADTYGANVEPKEVMHSLRQFRDKQTAREHMLLYGWGDGGGGPTEEMLHKRRRMQDLDGVPRLVSAPPSDFWSRARASARDEGAPVWRGELYLEKHRGTLTTCGDIKRDNRRAEELMRVLELAEAVTGADLRTADNWPAILVNQFHDAIPGTSIPEVYEDTAAFYRELLGADPRSNAAGEARVSEAAQAAARGGVATLAAPAPAPAPAAEGGEGALLVFNALEWAREEVVSLGGDGTLARVRAPPMGFAVVDRAASVTATQIPSEERACAVEANARGAGCVTLSNAHVSATIDRAGRIISLVLPGPARGHDMCVAGRPGNVFAVFRDVSRYWSQWDCDLEHLDAREEVGADRVASELRIVDDGSANGGLRVAAEASVALSPRSTATMRFTLDTGAKELRIAYEIDWHERYRMLKVEFPANVRSDQATHEIQFGHIRRPNHYNTSHDTARFEVCAHRWVDLAEHRFGLSVLNDSKYGHAVHGDTVSVSLLRSSKEPHPEMDVGVHRFTLALMPHRGAFQDAGTFECAAQLNSPLRVQEARPSDPIREVSFLTVSPRAVAVSAVKNAADSSSSSPPPGSSASSAGSRRSRGRDVIVRVHERDGSHTGDAAVLTGALVDAAVAVEVTNLLEDREWKDARRDVSLVNVSNTKNNGKGKKIVVEGGLRPFEILTLRLTLGDVN